MLSRRSRNRTYTRSMSTRSHGVCGRKGLWSKDGSGSVVATEPGLAGQLGDVCEARDTQERCGTLDAQTLKRNELQAV